MKKLWLPLLIVAIWLVLFVAGPFYAGGKMEQKLDNLITKMNTNGIVKFEKASYDKGLMSSDTVLTMTINTAMFGPAFQQTAGGAPQIEPISLKGEVKHGPLLLDHGFEFAVGRISFVPDVDEEHMKKIAEVFGTEKPLNVSIQFNWDKSFKLEGSLVEFAIADKGVSSSKMSFDAELNDAGKHLVSSFNWDGMSIKEPKTGNSFDISRVTSSSDQVQAVEEIWVGKGKLGVESIAFSQMGQAGSIDNIDISATTSADDANAYMNGLVDMSIDKVNVAGVDYMEDFSYKVSFNHLQIEGLQKISKAMQEAQQAGSTPEAMQMAMGMQMMGTLPEMVSKGFSINIDELNAKVMGEQITSNLKIDVAEGTDVSAGMAAIAGVTINAEVSVSKALLTKIPAGIPPEMVKGLIAQGFIIEEDGFLKSKAQFKGGQLTVNGNPMPIPGL